MKQVKQRNQQTNFGAIMKHLKRIQRRNKSEYNRARKYSSLNSIWWDKHIWKIFKIYICKKQVESVKTCGSIWKINEHYRITYKDNNYPNHVDELKGDRDRLDRLHQLCSYISVALQLIILFYFVISYLIKSYIFWQWVESVIM